MKTVIRLFMLLALTATINSCAFHSGVMTGNAALSDANFKVVDYAIGTSETIKIFGLGGVATDALVLEAKRNLYENYPLKEGQALANISVDFKRAFFPILSKDKVVISADIIDFNEGAIAKQNVDEFPIGADNVRNNELNLSNEMVYLKHQGELKTGKVVGYGEFRVKVMVHSRRDRLRVKRVPIKNLFYKKHMEELLETKYKIGDEISYTEFIVDARGNDKEVKRFGIIVAMGQNSVIVEYEIENRPKKFAVRYKDINDKE